MATEGKASAQGFSEIQRKKREGERDSIIKAKTVKYLLLIIWDGSGRRTEDPESVYLS